MRHPTSLRRALTAVRIAFASVFLASVAQAQATMSDPMKAGMKGAMDHGAMSAPKMIQNVDAAGVAIKGFDPVAYFTAAKPMKGVAEFSAVHNGATFRFASAANRDAFVSAPEKYAPQYGGYCAMGVAYNGKFDIDPDAWRVENGKLYLNKDLKTQQMWFKDIPGNVIKADKIWPVLGAAK